MSCNDPYSPLETLAPADSLEVFMSRLRMLARAQWLDEVRRDQAHRWRSGRHVLLEDYFQRCPELTENEEDTVVLLVGEILLRRKAGQEPTLKEYQRRFPQLAAQMSVQFQLDRLWVDESIGNAPRIVCPVCHNEIEQPEGSIADELVCPACGSSFRLARDITSNWHPGDQQRRIGKYELIEAVGVGAFGTVYKARDSELDRTVAIKLPRAVHLTGKEDLERFLREARSVARLRHPSIVSVHEIGQSDETPYLVSEFVEGTTLADLLSARRPAPREAAELVATVADALHYAHQMGVVHRDVKPANIMLDEKGAPRLMDFGLAKRETGDVTMTMDGQVLGTPAYMSPEQARGESHRVDGRSDVYSLGAVLYQLLTGELPFRGTTRMLLHQVLHDEPRRPRSLSHLVPRDLETICLRAMAKEAGRRFATARDMADDLRRFLKGEPIHARPIGRAERAWRWCRRNPVVAGLATTVVVCLAGVVLFFGLYAQRERARAIDLQQSLARQYLRRGQSLCEQGDLARGLHWLARSLKETPEHSTALQEVIRENLAGWAAQWVAPHAVLLHEATFLAIAMSPDGKRAVTSSFGGTVRFWSVETGELLSLTPKPDARVQRIAFSPDGRRVVTSSVNHTAFLWDANTGTPIGVTFRHEDSVRDAVFSPDGKLVATASRDKTARLWNSETAEPTNSPMRHDHPLDRVAFSRDGQRLLTAALTDATARVWNVGTGTPVGGTIHDQAQWTDVALSPDGKTILTGSEDKTARLWSAESGLPVCAPMRHIQDVTSVAFSPDGNGVLTGCADGTARLWNAKTGEPTDLVLQHQGSVHVAMFSADGKWILTGSVDGKVRLWAADTGRLFGLPFHHKDSISLVALAGHNVLTAGDEPVAVLWSVQPVPAVGAVPAGPLIGSTLAFSADGDRILICDELEQSAKWWSLKTGQTERSMLWDGEGEYFWAVAFSADGKRALIGHQDKVARLWSLENGERLLFTFHHAGEVRAVAVSSDGKRVATASFDGTARFWSAESGRPIGAPLRHSSFVEDVAFNPDGTLVVTACGDGAARIWSVETGRQVGPELRHRAWVLAATFNPDGKLVATGSRDKTAKFWDASTGRAVGSVLDHRGWVEDVCFSRDGKRLATGSSDGTVRLWSVETGELLGPPLDIDGSAREVAFSPDGTRVAAAGDGGSPRLWTVPPPFRGDLTNAERWVQVLTWQEMDANGVLSWLPRATWQARREQLSKVAEQ